MHGVEGGSWKRSVTATAPTPYLTSESPQRDDLRPNGASHPATPGCLPNAPSPPGSRSSGVALLVTAPWPTTALRHPSCARAALPTAFLALVPTPTTAGPLEDTSQEGGYQGLPENTSSHSVPAQRPDRSDDRRSGPRAGTAGWASPAWGARPRIDRFPPASPSGAHVRARMEGAEFVSSGGAFGREQ